MKTHTRLILIGAAALSVGGCAGYDTYTHASYSATSYYQQPQQAVYYQQPVPVYQPAIQATYGRNILAEFAATKPSRSIAVPAGTVILPPPRVISDSYSVAVTSLLPQIE